MRLSIIVPVFNEAERIVSCLGRLRAFMAAGHEVIVVDGGSGDRTRDLAMGWAA
ncbi:MAG: glycosyltransferase, partial [Gammaproteobacteria bacterium]|nr:glycosyltransferase [Gammaproteobacteria bacterium]